MVANIESTYIPFNGVMKILREAITTDNKSVRKALYSCLVQVTKLGTDITTAKTIDGEFLPTLAGVLDFGQGDDDQIMPMLNSWYQFVTAFIDLDLTDRLWWRKLNQSTFTDELMHDQVSRINWDELYEVINTISIILIGSYINDDRFFKAIEMLNKSRAGYRPNEKNNKKTEASEAKD